MIKLNTLLLENKQGILSSPHKHIVGSQGVVYTPPQGEEVIKDFLKNFEQVYNGFNEKKEIDPLLKLPMLHYQFEAIHPFGDGNGRIGRILAVLFLVLHDKLTLPILFLSESILLARQQYYTFLSAIDRGEKNALFDFTLRFLSLIEQQAYKTGIMILRIEQLMKETKKKLKTNAKLTKIYSHELVDYLFTRPYYDMEGLISMLHIHRNTATSYFSALAEVNLINSVKI
jgi:Fic family protein